MKKIIINKVIFYQKNGNFRFNCGDLTTKVARDKENDKKTLILRLNGCIIVSDNHKSIGE